MNLLPKLARMVTLLITGTSITALLFCNSACNNFRNFVVVIFALFVLMAVYVLRSSFHFESQDNY